MNLDLAVGALGDLADDGVAVAVAVDERDEDVEGHRRQRQERGDRVGVVRCHHPDYIPSEYSVNVYSRERDERA